MSYSILYLGMQSSIKQQVEKAVSIAGGQTAVAKAIGVGRSSVFHWVKNGVVPADRVMILVELGDHQVRAEELRPDVFTFNPACRKP